MRGPLQFLKPRVHVSGEHLTGLVAQADSLRLIVNMIVNRPNLPEATL
jgi:hypothetical protein